MTKVSNGKRFLMLFLVSWITFTSVFGTYQESAHGAELLGGVVLGPMLTALLVTGVVVAGGVAIYEITQTDSEDYTNFYQHIKSGFQDFVSEQEKQIALEKDSSLTDQQASDIGVANAREYVNNFTDNAIEQTKTTGSALKAKAMDYWQLYSNIISDIADNGIQETGQITDTTIIKQTARNYSYAIFNGLNQMNNVGLNCRLYEDNWYIYKGNYTNVKNQTVEKQLSKTGEEVPYIYVELYEQPSNSGKYTVHSIMERYNFRNKTGEFMTGTSEYMYGQDFETAVNLVKLVVAGSSIPVIVCNTWQDFWSSLQSNPSSVIGVGSNGQSAEIPSYKRSIKTALEDTHFGSAIQTGRRTLVNNGDYVGAIYKPDSVVTKKAGTAVNEGVVTSHVGYDIPGEGVWEDVLIGNKPIGHVVGKTGSIAVPKGAVTGTGADDTEVEYPEDTPVQDSADYPEDIPDDPTSPVDPSIPEKPAQDVFENQGGTFYPSEFDLTNLFPFCIPFDIIYLIDKFDTSGDNAPVITIPIVYPSVIQSAMGTSGYDVVIDFQDFIVLRNIMRVFILLLFIAGLMKITRDLIRG